MKLENIKSVYKSYFAGVSIAVLYVYFAQYFFGLINTVVSWIFDTSSPVILVTYILYICFGFYLFFFLIRRNQFAAHGFLVTCLLPFIVFALFMIEIAVHPPSEE